MEIDAFNTKLNHGDVLGVEFCTGYTDKNGLVVKGFYCHREHLLFCCGDAQNKFCCSQTERLAQQQLYLLEQQNGQTSVLNTRAVSMITLISASVLTFVITIIITAFIISTCQRIFAKKCRSNCTGICLSNSCNNLNNNTGNDLCRSLEGSITPITTIATSTILMNNPTNNSDDLNALNNAPNLMSNPINNVNNLNDQINYSGPISNCSSTSTDQCTIDTNSTLLTNLSDGSNSTNNAITNFNYNNYNFNSSLAPNISNINYSTASNSVNQQQPTSLNSRLTNALASITNLLTNNSNQRNQLDTSNNSIFHISGSDQLNELEQAIINQPPPPAYSSSEISRTELPIDYSIQSYYNNELCT